MAFTYDLAATGDALSISKIRLEIGDTNNAADSGVKPDGRNFSDEELLYFYQSEANNVLAGAAHACEVLARLWAGVGESVRIRDYTIDSKGKAEAYAALGHDLRAKSGSLYASGSAPTVRIDGNSGQATGQPANSQQIQPSGEYWQKRKVIRWP